MDDDITLKKPGPLSYVGCGCAGIGALIFVAGLGTLAAMAMGAFNYSVEGQAGIGGGCGLCAGLAVLGIGAALWSFGKKDVPLD